MKLTRRALLGAGPLALAPALSTILAATARAQVTVYDPAAVAQMLKQVSQGLQQIQALQAQLANSERMLQALGLDVTGRPSAPGPGAGLQRRRHQP
jgi:hypothetical protein